MLPLSPAAIPAAFAEARKLQQGGKLAEARAVYTRILAVKPDLAEVHFQLGQIAQAERDPHAAIAAYARAHELKPREPAVLRALARAYDDSGDTDQAALTMDRLIALDPKQIGPRADKALLLQRAGQFDAAEAELRKALKRAPKDGELYRILVAGRKIAPGDPLIGAMKRAYGDRSVTGLSRINLGFALSKAMEDTGAYGEVFAYLNAANRLSRKLQPYDIADRQAEVAALKTACAGYADLSPMTAETSDIAPIFVTGLPRSGTTLVEQILSGHSQVTAAGESALSLAETYATLRDRSGRLRPLSEIPDAEIAQIGHRYAAKMRQRLGFEHILTDKSIQSHLVIGVLKRALPNARFIVVRRDPRDLLLSIYKNYFRPGTHRYANDLSDLAAYHRTFTDILRFWRDQMPGEIFELRYEDLVDDPETQARALVAAAGLAWEDACLDTQANARQVKTLSIYQARQPIYRSSTKAWERYKDDLAPLIEALGDEVTPWD